MPKLPEDKQQELDRIVTALNMKLALVLAEYPEWEPLLARLLSGIMVVISAGQVDVLREVVTLVDPVMTRLAEEARTGLVKKNLGDRRN